MKKVAGDAEEEEVLAAEEVDEELMEAVEDVLNEGAESWIELEDGVWLLDDWQPLSKSEIEAITNSGDKYSDPNSWTEDLIDVEDLPLDIGVEDSAFSAIEGANEALAGAGDAFLDFSAANLEMLGVDAAEMSVEELIAYGLLADVGLVAAA